MARGGGGGGRSSGSSSKSDRGGGSTRGGGGGRKTDAASSDEGAKDGCCYAVDDTHRMASTCYEQTSMSLCERNAERGCAWHSGDIGKVDCEYVPVQVPERAGCCYGGDEKHLMYFQCFEIGEDESVCVHHLDDWGCLWNAGEDAVCEVPEPETPERDASPRPNIIFIMMDDLGFTDTGYLSNYENGNDYSFMMPHVEDMAGRGIRLNRHYTESVCAATRSALLSGRYAWRTGLDYQVTPGSTVHTDADMSLFPELMRDEYGYKTLMLGKWHIGYKDQSLLPFNRGFDEALFFTNAGQNYYEHTVCFPWVYFDEHTDIDPATRGRRNNMFGDGEQCAYDLWDENYNSVQSEEYNEVLFTERLVSTIRSSAETDTPFMAYYAMLTPHTPFTYPPDVGYSQCTHIFDEDRKILCEIVQFADGLIHDIELELKNAGTWDDTILIFLSDNGGSTGNARGQNLPLRGRKGSKFEAGIRTASFLSGGYVENLLDASGLSSCEYDNLFYVNDWYPTLMQMASHDSDAAIHAAVQSRDYVDIDGSALWSNILSECQVNDNNDYDDADDADLERELIVSARMCGGDEYFIETYVRDGDWKLIVNNTADCEGGDGGDGGAGDFWGDYTSEITRAPPLEIYTEFVNSERLNGNGLFTSECFEAMSEEDKANHDNFIYRELMLFNVRDDPMEACDVADDEPEIVNRLLAILNEQVRGQYKGSVEGVPTASAAMKQYLSWSCELEQSYLMAWEDDSCCDDPDFDDWDAAWSYVLKKVKCEYEDEMFISEKDRVSMANIRDVE